MVYTSQQIAASDRASYRADRLRVRLGGSVGIDQGLPPKPKGMWRRTYDRLAERFYETEEQEKEAWLQGVACILARSPRRKPQRSRMGR